MCGCTRFELTAGQMDGPERVHIGNWELDVAGEVMYQRVDFVVSGAKVKWFHKCGLDVCAAEVLLALEVVLVLVFLGSGKSALSMGWRCGDSSHLFIRQLCCKVHDTVSGVWQVDQIFL